MNTQVGKSFGIALLLAIGAIAVMLAWNPFTASAAFLSKSATASSHTASATPVTIVVTFNSGAVNKLHTVTLPAEIVTTSATATVTFKGVDVTSDANTSELQNAAKRTVRYKGTTAGEYVFTISNLMNPATTGSHSIKIDDEDTTVTVTTVVGVVATALTSSDATCAEGSAAGTTTKPGSVVALDLEAVVDVIDGASIYIDLTGFGVPSVIDEDSVRVSGSHANGNQASFIPAAVAVDGSKVTVRYAIKTDSRAAETAKTATKVTVDFRASAGITLPVLAGDHEIEIKSDTTTTAVDDCVQVERHISVSPEPAERGTEITITGLGFANGSADVITADTARVNLGNANSADGVFTLMINNNLTDSDDENVFGIEETQINAIDATGTSAKVANQGSHNIKAGLSLSDDSVSPGQSITITLNDVGASVTAKSATVGGTATTNAPKADADTTANDYELTIPSGIRLGSLQLKVTLSDDESLTHVVNVVANDLIISPTTAVQGQEITIAGSGFAIDGSGTSSVEVDGERGKILQTFVVNSDGDITLSVVVPNKASSGEVIVKVVDEHGRVGTGTLTIPTPTITVSPAESLRGSSVSVSGEGFSANDVIQLSYDGTIVSVGTSDSVGRMASTSFTVPNTAGIGTDNDITAKTQVNPDDADVAKIEHSTPDPDFDFSPSSAQAGSKITVSGMNFKGFDGLTLLKINGISVMPVPTPTTDASGSFNTSNVLVPQLDPGNYTLQLKLSDKTITKFIEVVPASDEPVVVVAELSADPSEVTPGDSLTISGANLPANQSVARLNVGGMSVLPDDLITEPDGSFTATVTTPELDAGEQKIEAIAGGERVSTKVTVLAVVSTEPADVFAELGARLLRVWEFDNATQEWSFYDPRPDRADFNSLTEMSSGDIATIIISSGDPIEFQGSNLYSGTNQIVLK